MMIARQKQRVLFDFVITDDGVPVNLSDVTDMALTVRETNATGRVLLNLTLGDGITIASNVVTIAIAAPTYQGFGGGADYSLSMTTEDGTRSILEGPFSVKEFVPVP
jgi:hypothetical protein